MPGDGVGQVGIFPWSRPMPHDHSSIPQGGLIASILTSITDPAHDHSNIAQGGIFPDLWLGASPFVRQISGMVTFQTNEGVNANTIVVIKGRGTGYGELRKYDEDNNEYLQMYCSGGLGHIRIPGVAPGGLNVQYAEAQDIKFWAGITTGNPYFYIYGYKTAVGVKYGRAYVDSNGYFNIDAEDLGILQQAGTTVLSWMNDHVRMLDDKTFRLGSDFDYSIGYRALDDTFQIVDGSILGANVRLKIDSAGNVTIGEITTSKINIGAFFLDTLVANNKVPDSDKVDGEEAADIVTDARVKAHFPDTIANILSNHTKAVHDALAIDADQVDGEEAADIVTNARVKAHFPDTLANIISNHTKAIHDALGIETLGAAVTVGGAGAGNITGGTVLNLKAGTNVAIQTTPSAAPTPTLFNGSVAFELDETGHDLVCRVQYSDGTAKTGLVNLI